VGCTACITAIRCAHHARDLPLDGSGTACKHRRNASSILPSIHTHHINSGARPSPFSNLSSEILDSPSLAKLSTFNFQLSTSPPPPTAAAPDSAATAPVAPFGRADTSYWHINFGAGIDFDERSITRAGVGLGYFIADNVSLDLDLALAFFDQPGDNAFGVNTSLLLRWHFITDDDHKWSIYGEAGAGLLGSTDDVPAHGTSFNFTPQLGAGFTFDLDGNPGGSRLFTGIRWFHISNANTFEDNPAVDFTMLHATIAFPF
jgi:hypothetical protein